VSSFAFILLVLFGAAVIIGGLIAFIAARKAPSGFEDKEGFHPMPRRKSKKERQ
jgi:hypothetical protein